LNASVNLSSQRFFGMITWSYLPLFYDYLEGMKIGVVREIKNGETRVALTPAVAAGLVDRETPVMVEQGAGLLSGYPDDEYAGAGCLVVPDAKTVWGECDLVLKVKEPQASEFNFFQPGRGLFTYLHLAANPDLEEAIKASGIAAFAYEDLQASDGSLPLLKPMSQIAGRLAPQIGARFLETAQGGAGVLLSGLPGVQRGVVTIVGAGNSGAQACRIALGLGARVIVLERDVSKLEHLEQEWGPRVETLLSNPDNLERSVAAADLLIGAVLIPARRAPIVVTKTMVQQMRPGSVIFDIAIDQGGCIEGIRPTTIREPSYLDDDGVCRVAVPNLPALVGRTATLALTQATEPYIQTFKRLGVEGAKTHPLLGRAWQKF
jgi:alanine dehydrogenase